MKKKTNYKSASVELADAVMRSEIIEDFLPAPELLIKKEENVKITILKLPRYCGQIVKQHF